MVGFTAEAWVEDTLAKRFPGCPFYVCKTVGTSSLSIRYFDGPTEADVRAVVAELEYQGLVEIVRGMRDDTEKAAFAMWVKAREELGLFVPESTFPRYGQPMYEEITVAGVTLAEGFPYQQVRELAFAVLLNQDEKAGEEAA